MQLIEIIQLTLLIFIVVSAIVFLISYLGYKKNTNTKAFSEIKKTVLIDTDQEIKFDDFKTDQKQNINPHKVVRKIPRFKVFTPSSNDDSIDKKANLNKSDLKTTQPLILKK